MIYVSLRENDMIQGLFQVPKKDSVTLLNKSIGKAFEVIESFERAGKQKLSVSEISEITDISVSTAYRMATSLVSLGYLNKNAPDKTYSLGWKLIRLFSAMNTFTENELITTGSPYVFELSEKFNENASIYVMMQRSRVCLYRVEGTQEVRNIVKPGDTTDITLGSPGKVLLAFSPEETWEIFAPASDANYIGKLRTIREQGYAVTDSEHTPGASSISAPIFGHNQKIIAALTLSGPSFRFKEGNFEEKIAAVVHYSKQISRAFTARN